MASIFTRKGEEILVDDERFDELSSFTWHINNSGYAVREIKTDRCASGRTAELMHRRVIELHPSDKRVADHINCNKLDNRRSNLRACDVTSNVRNRPKHRRNSCGLKGVHQRPETGRWRASIRVNYKLINLGHFATKEEAYEAYKLAALRYHGEFANFG